MQVAEDGDGVGAACGGIGFVAPGGQPCREVRRAAQRGDGGGAGNRDAAGEGAPGAGGRQPCLARGEAEAGKDGGRPRTPCGGQVAHDRRAAGEIEFGGDAKGDAGRRDDAHERDPRGLSGDEGEAAQGERSVVLLDGDQRGAVAARDRLVEKAGQLRGQMAAVGRERRFDARAGVAAGIGLKDAVLAGADRPRAAGAHGNAGPATALDVVGGGVGVEPGNGELGACGRPGERVAVGGGGGDGLADVAGLRDGANLRGIGRIGEGEEAAGGGIGRGDRRFSDDGDGVALDDGEKRLVEVGVGVRAPDRHRVGSRRRRHHEEAVRDGARGGVAIGVHVAAVGGRAAPEEVLQAGAGLAPDCRAAAAVELADLVAAEIDHHLVGVDVAEGRLPDSGTEDAIVDGVGE